jgi:hypothetical protein
MQAPEVVYLGAGLNWVQMTDEERQAVYAAKLVICRDVNPTIVRMIASGSPNDQIRLVTVPWESSPPPEAETFQYRNSSQRWAMHYQYALLCAAQSKLLPVNTWNDGSRLVDLHRGDAHRLIYRVIEPAFECYEGAIHGLHLEAWYTDPGWLWPDVFQYGDDWRFQWGRMAMRILLKLRKFATKHGLLLCAQATSVYAHGYGGPSICQEPSDFRWLQAGAFNGLKWELFNEWSYSDRSGRFCGPAWARKRMKQPKLGWCEAVTKSEEKASSIRSWAKKNNLLFFWTDPENRRNEIPKP